MTVEVEPEVKSEFEILKWSELLRSRLPEPEVESRIELNPELRIILEPIFRVVDRAANWSGTRDWDGIDTEPNSEDEFLD